MLQMFMEATLKDKIMIVNNYAAKYLANVKLDDQLLVDYYKHKIPELSKDLVDLEKFTIENQKTIDPRLINPNVVYQSLQAANDAKRWKLKLENTYIEREIFCPVPSKENFSCPYLDLNRKEKSRSMTSWIGLRKNLNKQLA